MLATLATLVWSLYRAGPLLQLNTDSYRQAAAFIESLEQPVVTQLSKNYYFYEKRKSLEIRWQKIDDLVRLVDRSPSVILAIDPIVHRLPDIREWIETLRPRMELIRRFKVRMYEPLHYQGFDPTAGLESLPRSVAPTRPNQTWIEVYRLSGAAKEEVGETRATESTTQGLP